MSRPASPWLLAATLATGLALGLGLARLGPSLTTPATGAPRGDAAPAASTSPAPGARGGEDAIYRELAQQYDRFQHVNRTFELVARAVSPAVVHIVARKIGQRDNGKTYLYEETGSGVIVRGEAGRGRFVLTNNHVVEGAPAQDCQVFLDDGRALRPDRVWMDPKTDVAVLRLDVEDLPTARLGDSDEASVGSWVLALGSPFGLTQSVTQGIISARMRHEEELENEGVVNQQFLQTDAAINPGNSGGPLVNMKGEVIGINTAIASNGGGSEGVGFSIPINLAKWAMGQLVTTGKVSRGAMGVRLEAVEPQVALDLGLDRPRGARIESVQEGSPAARAGLTAGDVILSFNGAEVVNFNQLINMISMTPVGKAAEVVLWRDHRRVPVRVGIIDRDVMLAQERPEARPAARPGNGPLRRPPRPAPAPESAPANLGLELVTLDVASARQLGLPETLRGVAVKRVEPNSPLAASLQALDVIGTVGGRAVRTADEVALALSRRRGADPLEIGLQRPIDGMMRALTIRVP
jgi:serine protease Do